MCVCVVVVVKIFYRLPPTLHKEQQKIWSLPHILFLCCCFKWKVLLHFLIYEWINIWMALRSQKHWILKHKISCIARTRTPVVCVYVYKSFLKIEDKTLFCERLWIRIWNLYKILCKLIITISPDNDDSLSFR